MNTFLGHFKMKVPVLICFFILFSLCSSSKPPLEIKVADFGALPNDGKNDEPAIISAIDVCRSKENTKLIFEWGIYDINGGQKNERGRSQPSIDIKNIKNMTIEGNGAEFIGHDFSTMFNFTECHNITIKNLTVDWDPIPFTQGKVVSIGDDYVDIEVTAPSTANTGCRTEGLLGYDLERRRMARRYTDHYQSGFKKTTEVIRPGVMRHFVGREHRFAGKMPSAGQYIIARHQIYGNQALQFSKCSKIQIENVNIYSNPGMGVVARLSRDFYIRHLRVMIRPGSGRWMSCTADATNFRGCRGSIVMENCLFEGMGDDATNVRSGSYMVIAERLEDRKLSISSGARGGFPSEPEVGDKLELSGEDKMLVPYATMTVKSVNRNEKEKTLIVEFDDKLPEKTREGDIVGNASACPFLHIRGCTVIRNRARGLIIKNRGAIVEDCYFQDITASAIGMNTDITTWWESIGSHDIIIRNNRFLNCRFDPDVVRGVIECSTNPGSNQNAPAGVHQRIKIENNIIQGSNANAIKIGSADGVVIHNNIIDQIKDEAILIYNSRNVRLTGNKITNSNIGLKIGKGCDTATIKAENNIGF
ncbi:right-handed parallel beta-helix repeat-containing protein [candidate division KSB1 bacterium]